MIRGAIARMDIAPQEAVGLREVSVDGSMAQVNLRLFSGSAPRSRMLRLGESVGASGC